MNRENLLSYAREAADFCTSKQLPQLDYAVNAQNTEDIAMFDFTSMYAAENAAMIFEMKGHRLLTCLAGDSLMEVGVSYQSDTGKNSEKIRCLELDLNSKPIRDNEFFVVLSSVGLK